MKRISALMIALLLLLTTCALADSGFSSDPDAMESVAKSVLMLEVLDDSNYVLATGSGFVAFDNRTLVTNYHVIEGASWMVANSDDGYQYVVNSVLIADPEKDIAICGFMSPTDLQPLTLNSGDALKRGSSVVAIGSPNGITNSVSTGIISAVYEDAGVSWIQFTAPISEGSSGGALLNDDGEVIGITSATYENTQNMNIAVNVSEVTDLYAQWDGTKTVMDEYVPSYSAQTSQASQASQETQETEDTQASTEPYCPIQINNTGLDRFFPAMEYASCLDDVITLFEDGYEFEDVEVESNDGTSCEIWIDASDYTYCDLPLLYCIWTYDGTYNTTDEVLLLQGEDEEAFAEARDVMVEQYGTPDFGYLELYGSGYTAWSEYSNGRHEVRLLSQNEMTYRSISYMLNACTLSNCDYDLIMYWNNLHLYYGQNDGTSYLWVASSDTTYETIQLYYENVFE